MNPPQLPPEGTQLGSLKTSHEANQAAGSAVKTLLYLAALCAVFGILLIFWGYSQYTSSYARKTFSNSYAARQGLAFAGAGLAVMLAGGGMVAVSRLLRNVRVDVFDQGFAFTDWRKQQKVFRWDDIAAIYETIITGRRYHITQRTYTVHRKDGQQVKLTGLVSNVWKLGSAIQKEIAARRFPQAMRAYQAGETVRFGQDLGLCQQGIRYEQELLPWSEVAGIRLNSFEDVVILVKQEGQQHPALRLVFHSNIDNFSLFQAMVDQILKPGSQSK